MDYKKKFLVIGNFNMVTYKEIFPYIKEGKLRTGKNWVKEFNMPDGKKKKFGNICWFTNLETHKADDPMELVEKFDPVNKHLHYDNYDAYNVDKVADIPYDTDEVLGVPLTIAYRIADDGYIHFTHTSERERELKFRIIDINPHFFITIATGNPKPKQVSVNGKDVYSRIFIQKIFDTE